MPVSRRPDLAREETNKVAVCRECHANMTTYRWRIERVDDFWHTVDTRTNQVLARRYAPPMGAALATPTAQLGRVVSEGSGRALVQKLALESDENLRIVDKYFGTLSKAASWARALVRYEAYQRWPYKEGTCEHHQPRAIHDLAPSFHCSEKTLWEDVHAAELYAEDDTGPPMPASWYRQASHVADRQEGLRIAREVWQQGGTIPALRARLGLASGRRRKCTCPLCGTVHLAVATTPAMTKPATRPVSRRLL